MIASTTDILRRLNSTYPAFNQWWRTDKKFEYVEECDLERILPLCSVSDRGFITNIFECEEYALTFLANVREMERREALENPARRRFNRAIGISTGVLGGLDVLGGSGMHTRITAVGEKRIWDVEIQDDSIAEADRRKFNLLLNFM